MSEGVKHSESISEALKNISISGQVDKSAVRVLAEKSKEQEEKLKDQQDQLKERDEKLKVVEEQLILMKTNEKNFPKIRESKLKSLVKSNDDDNLEIRRK